MLGHSMQVLLDTYARALIESPETISDLDDAISEARARATTRASVDLPLGDLLGRLGGQ
jgi:hypothetical protein